MALLVATDISKRYGGGRILACDRANLRLRAGAVHAVVGENGAGKSTLMHILSGSVEPDSGDIRVGDRSVSFRSPSDALAEGIVISFQHPRLVETLTVWQNLVLGAEPVTRLGTISRREAIRRITERLFHVPGLDLNARVGRLSSGHARLVSLMAAVLRLPSDRPGVLILDEPTAACSPSETAEVMSAVRAAAAAGHGVLYISHRIPEVMDLADTATVMRNGRSIATVSHPFSPGEITDLVFGGPVDGDALRTKHRMPLREADRNAPPVLAVRNLCARDGVRVLLNEVTFAVHGGEILGLTGIRQSGIETIEDILGGMRRPSSGCITLNGAELTRLSPRDLRRRGVAYVPTNRLLRGASMKSSVAENLIVLERNHLQRAGVFLHEKVHEFGSRLADDFQIGTTLHARLDELSGGTIQKVILSRELARSPRLLIVCEPSWGLDVRNKELIAARIRRVADDGSAVVLISTDIDEVIELSDVIGAFYAGVLSEIVSASETDRAELGRLAFGAGSHRSAADG